MTEQLASLYDRFGVWLILVVFVLSVGALTPTGAQLDPHDGQPPFCDNKNIPCKCHKECDEAGNPTGVEDPKCEKHCQPQHCHCACATPT